MNRSPIFNRQQKMRNLGTYFFGILTGMGAVLSFLVHGGFFVLIAMGIFGYKLTERPENE